jgi:hypothetical protein
MRDKWMNDSLVVYIEKEIFDKINNEAIMKRFKIWKLEENNYNASFFSLKVFLN